MIGVTVGIVILAVACLAAAFRILRGPTEADRAVAGDLLLFGFVGLIALFGVRAVSYTHLTLPTILLV